MSACKAPFAPSTSSSSVLPMLFLVRGPLRSTPDKSNEVCRVPNPASSRQICLLYVLVHRTRSLLHLCWRPLLLGQHLEVPGRWCHHTRWYRLCRARIRAQHRASGQHEVRVDECCHDQKAHATTGMPTQVGEPSKCRGQKVSVEWIERQQCTRYGGIDHILAMYTYDKRWEMEQRGCCTE